MATRSARAAARVVRATQRAGARKWTFLALFVLIFASSFVFLANLGLTPNTARAEAPSSSNSIPVVSLAAGPIFAATSHTSELPVKIAIPSINLEAIVANPTSTDTAVLDQTLLGGAARYPTSAKLGEIGNVVLFGHSSYLPIVNNPAYKTFDGIQKLKAGDTITVYSLGATYTYAVRTVVKESAASDAGIPLNVSGRVLTLSTCDSFGEKTDRFVVTADFVESHAISS